jgi:hypothetical protein
VSATGYTFVDGPHWLSDLGRIELDAGAQTELECALEDLLHAEGAGKVSHELGDDTDIRYVRSRDFPVLKISPLYMTFRFERDGLIERRRIFTEADLRAGFLVDAGEF